MSAEVHPELAGLAAARLRIAADLIHACAEQVKPYAEDAAGDLADVADGLHARARRITQATKENAR